MSEQANICSQCGAPLQSKVCQYCKTRYGSAQKYAGPELPETEVFDASNASGSKHSRNSFFATSLVNISSFGIFGSHR